MGLQKKLRKKNDIKVGRDDYLTHILVYTMIFSFVLVFLFLPLS